jgi:hypothetical protein
MRVDYALLWFMVDIPISKSRGLYSRDIYGTAFFQDGLEARSKHFFQVVKSHMTSKRKKIT